MKRMMILVVDSSLVPLEKLPVSHHEDVEDDVFLSCPRQVNKKEIHKKIRILFRDDTFDGNKV